MDFFVRGEEESEAAERRPKIKIRSVIIKSEMCSSEHIQNEVLIITYEHASSEDHFECKFQADISPSESKF